MTEDCVGGYVGGFPDRFQETCPMESPQFLKLLKLTATLSVFVLIPEDPCGSIDFLNSSIRSCFQE